MVGTAHFSKESNEDVTKTIVAVQPDVVMVELCDKRSNVIQGVAVKLTNFMQWRNQGKFSYWMGAPSLR